MNSSVKAVRRAESINKIMRLADACLEAGATPTFCIVPTNVWEVFMDGVHQPKRLIVGWRGGNILTMHSRWAIQIFVGGDILKDAFEEVLANEDYQEGDREL